VRDKDMSFWWVLLTEKEKEADIKAAKAVSTKGDQALYFQAVVA
jgi:hypothetical protein